MLSSGKTLFFVGLGPEQPLHLLELVRHFRGEVVRLGIVLDDVVKFPFVAVSRSGSLPVASSQGAAGGVVAAIQPSW